MANKQVSPKSAKAAIPSSVEVDTLPSVDKPSRDQLVALGLQADEASREWIRNHAPAFVHQAVAFGDAVRELESAGANTPIARDVLQKSAIELFKDGQTAVERLNKEANDERERAGKTVFPLYFLRMLRYAGEDSLGDWINEHAPEQIQKLWSATRTLLASEEFPDFCTLAEYGQAFADIAHGRKFVGGDDEWVSTPFVQPDEVADGTRAA